jgi:alpha-ribazole phosphatase
VRYEWFDVSGALRGKGHDVILVVGGLSAGKRAYARSLGYTDDEIVADAQELVRDESVDPAEIADSLADRRIVLVCEVGSGVVPMQREERAWRDRVGALSRHLAEHADTVVRVVCGIPQVLKGTLPLDEVELVIMRHGTTTANEQRAYAGKIDVPLTEQGEREALAAGVCEQVKTVYVSSLSRAKRTAELCFPHAWQIEVDDLKEMDFGAFEGRSARDMEDDEEYRAWVDGFCEGRCPGGEQRSEFTERVARAVDHVVRDAMRNGLCRVVIVGHGGTIMAAMHAFTNSDRSYFEWRAGNCEGYRVRARILEGALVFEDEEQFDSLEFLDGPPQPCSSFFQNRSCPHFPCHEGVREDEFNCLFCYCPLYALGPNCGGNFTYTKKGRKNCTTCVLPHVRENGARLVSEKYELLADLAGK